MNHLLLNILFAVVFAALYVGALLAVCWVGWAIRDRNSDRHLPRGFFGEETS